MNNIKKITDANKRAWNQVMPKHQLVNKEKFDQKFSDHDYTIHDKKQIENLTGLSISNANIVHLCCNNGIDLLSFKNMGAKKCVGIDNSDLAIEEAKQRAYKNNYQQIDYICSDVYDIDEYSHLHHEFDLIYINVGTLGWMPDLKNFFNIAKKLLKYNGKILINDIHPLADMVNDDRDMKENPLLIVRDYFDDSPVINTTGLDYVGKTNYNPVINYWFVHNISDIINNLIISNFKIEYFDESKEDISGVFPVLTEQKINIPLSFTIVAELNE